MRAMRGRDAHEVWCLAFMFLIIICIGQMLLIFWLSYYGLTGFGAVTFPHAFTLPLAALHGQSAVQSSLPSPRTTLLRPRKLPYGVGHPRHHGLYSYARALRKYGAAPDIVARLTELSIKHAASSRGPASTGTKIGITRNSQSAEPFAAVSVEGDLEFNSPVQIGSQTFSMDLDTGSADFLVFGKDAAGTLSNQTLYSPGPSATQLKNETFYLRYGDGSVATGIVYRDTISIGGVTLPGQAVEVANSESGNFESTDGILGLGFDNNNAVQPNPQKTLFTNLISANLISSPILSADLRHNAVGCYTFGSTPSWQYSGEITYTPIDSSDGFWKFAPKGYAIGSSGATFNTSSAAAKKTLGVADTGTTLMIVQYSLAQAYWSKTKTGKFDYFEASYIFDCNETLPNFRLLIEGDFEVVVPGEYMNFDSYYGNLCYGGLQPDTAGLGFNIYGDVFLKSVFAVFDRGVEGGRGPRMGFARKA